MMLTSPTTASWIRASPIETLVTRACDPSLHEPNYAIHLEVAEYINTKKANKYVYKFLYLCIEVSHVEVLEKPPCSSLG